MLQSQGYELHSYNGPHHINEKHLKHAQMREQDLKAKRTAQAKLLKEQSIKLTEEEQLKLLKDIEPPWSWIHQFASHNCCDKSFNFLENLSIASDETPSESSDESFDFERGQFISPPREESQSQLQDEDTKSELSVANALLGDSTERLAEKRVRDLHAIVNVKELMTDMMILVEKAESSKKINIRNTPSIVSFMQEQEIAVHEKGFIDTVKDALVKADEENIIFNDLKQLHDYLKTELQVSESEGEVEAESDSTLVQEPDKKSLSETVSDETDEIVVLHPEPKEPQLTDRILECDVEVDEKITNKEIPANMILGLTTTSVKSITPIPTPIETPLSSPTTHNTDSHRRTSDVSSRIIDFTEEATPIASSIDSPKPAPPFNCTILPIRGIGKSISKETMQNFLTYAKIRSRDENGMVFPRFFKEAKCPNMVDTREG